MSELKYQIMLNKERSCVPCYLKSEADKVIAYHKYKRCLAMARMCSSYKFAWSFIPEDDEVHKSDFYKKCSERWLELAEKFKPNKE